MNTLLTFIDSFRGKHYLIMNYEFDQFRILIRN